MSSPQCKITYLAATRSSDKSILASSFHSHVSSRERSEIESEFIEYIKKESFVAGGRKNINIASAYGGKLYFMMDVSGKLIFTAGIKSSEMSESVVYKMLDEFAIKLNSAHGSQVDGASTESLSRPMKKTMKDIMLKYDGSGAGGYQAFNIADDKTSEVHQKVEEVQGIMNENVRKIMDNTSNLENLENKTDNMSRQANQFLKQSVDLRRSMQVRNFKLKIILGVVVLCLALYIIIPLVK